MSLTSDNSFNNEYDYSDDIYEESMWSTTSFCADPLLVDFFESRKVLSFGIGFLI